MSAVEPETAERPAAEARTPDLRRGTPHPTSAQGRGTALPKGTLRVLGSAFAGTTIEWYDFYLYGIAAATVFSKQFFHGGTPLVALLASFSTLAVGVLVRPVGGIVAGHIGDRVGRKALLVVSLLTMGLASMLIGLLPVWSSIGVWAPILLVLLRVVQGLSAGAEWGGSALLSVEHAPAERRGLFGSFTQIGSAGGMLLATGANALVHLVCTESQFDAFGWRLPFLLSGVLVAVALWIRLGVTDAPEFLRAREAGELSPVPVVRVLREHPRALVVTILLRVAQNGIYYLVTIYLLTYLSDRRGGTGSALVAIMVASGIGLVSGPVWGALSDRIGRRPVSVAAYAGIGVLGWTIFWAADHGSLGLLSLIIVLGLILAHDGVYGPQAAWFAEQFPVEVRYSGVSLGYQLGTVVGGGLMPFIATLLYEWGHHTSWLITSYLTVLVVLSLVAALLAEDPVGHLARRRRTAAPSDAVPSGTQETR